MTERISGFNRSRTGEGKDRQSAVNGYRGNMEKSDIPVKVKAMSR